MNISALIAITAGSAVSTITGLIASAIRRRRRRPSDEAKELYTPFTIKRDGKEMIYRIESNTREAAEATIRDIIEHAEN